MARKEYHGVKVGEGPSKSGQESLGIFVAIGCMLLIVLSCSYIGSPVMRKIYLSDSSHYNGYNI